MVTVYIEMLETMSSKTQESDINLGWHQSYIVELLGLVWINIMQDVLLIEFGPTEL